MLYMAIKNLVEYLTHNKRDREGANPLENK